MRLRLRTIRQAYLLFRAELLPPPDGAWDDLGKVGGAGGNRKQVDLAAEVAAADPTAAAAMTGVAVGAMAAAAAGRGRAPWAAGGGAAAVAAEGAAAAARDGSNSGAATRRQPAAAAGPETLAVRWCRPEEIPFDEVCVWLHGCIIAAEAMSEKLCVEQRCGGLRTGQLSRPVSVSAQFVRHPPLSVRVLPASRTHSPTRTLHRSRSRASASRCGCGARTPPQLPGDGAERADRLPFACTTPPSKRCRARRPTTLPTFSCAITM